MAAQARHVYERNLPHIMEPGTDLFITFRLKGSLPKAVIRRIKEEDAEQRRQALARLEKEADRQLRIRHIRRRSFLRVDRLLDSYQHGPTWLKQKAIADVVAEALHFFDEEAYRLHAYCIMPNHVHLVLTY